MKKTLKKRLNRGQKNLQIYGCGCDCAACSGCGGSSSTDYLNVKENKYYGIYSEIQYRHNQ